MHLFFREVVGGIATGCCIVEAILEYNLAFLFIVLQFCGWWIWVTIQNK